MKELRVIIAGTRTFNDYYFLRKTVQKILDHKINAPYQTVIISGTARGADTLGERYAEENGYLIKRFPADWNTYGKSAGYIRNEQMAKYACADGNTGVLIAFWDGVSRGTMHMINLARKYGLDVHVVDI